MEILAHETRKDWHIVTLDDYTEGRQVGRAIGGFRGKVMSAWAYWNKDRVVNFAADTEQLQHIAEHIQPPSPSLDAYLGALAVPVRHLHLVPPIVSEVPPVLGTPVKNAREA